MLRQDEKASGVQLEHGSHSEAFVEVKYIGTASDQHDMKILGRKQVLRRNFQLLPMVGFTAVLIATWELLFVNLLFNLTDGGTAGIFWGYTLVVFASVFIYLSVAELASMSPTAGGQYHWVSEYAPPAYQKFLSYMTGWVIAIGWQGSVVSLSFSAGTIAQALIALNDPTYQAQPWQGTLFVIAFICFAIAFNILTSKYLPMVQSVLLVLHILGLFAVTIPLLVMAPEKNSAKDALLVINNGGGWLTDGAALMVGLLCPLSTQMGYDCAVHMSEEIRDASSTLPKAILWSVTVNILMGYLAVLTQCFTIVDIPKLLEEGGVFPMIPYFLSITKSKAATTTMSAIIIAVLVSAVIAEVATASRQIWAFSRDNGFPFSAFLRQVNPKHPIPLNALLVSLVVGIGLSLINLGSAIALNAIVSMTLSALIASYILSIGCVLSKRLRREPLPAARWSLGKAGLWINISAMVFLIPLFIFCFFPLAANPDPTTMNWSSAMFGGIMLLSAIWYILKGRKVYTPPVRLVKRDM